MEPITQKNPFLTVVIGDSNARSSKWWTDDQTIQEDLKIENLLSHFPLSQVINWEFIFHFILIAITK